MLQKESSSGVQSTNAWLCLLVVTRKTDKVSYFIVQISKIDRSKNVSKMCSFQNIRDPFLYNEKWLKNANNDTSEINMTQYVT